VNRPFSWRGRPYWIGFSGESVTPVIYGGRWTCGFYPGVEPRLHRDGTAPTFEDARAGFEAAWNLLLPTLAEAAFDEWRSDRDFRAKIRETRERGEKLDTERPSSMMLCVCGEMFDSHDPAGSLPHRRHIYAAQASA
jgi:hypothetical protein